jgi:hypothetical protein
MSSPLVQNPGQAKLPAGGIRPVFQVICPKLEYGDVMDIHKKTIDAADWARGRIGKGGTSSETVVLFSETAIKAERLPMPHDEMQAYLKLFSRTLPREPWLSLAFCAFERNLGAVSNTGYLITRGNAASQLKLRLTNYEKKALIEYAMNMDSDPFKAAKIAREIKGRHDAQAIKILGEEAGFLQVSTPSGMAFEYRVCEDVFYPASENGPSILLSSSAGLEIEPGEAQHFKTMLAHDSKNGIILGGRQPQLFSVSEEPEFWVATLIEEPAA